jgi:hypothetical protein
MGITVSLLRGCPGGGAGEVVPGGERGGETRVRANSKAEFNGMPVIRSHAHIHSNILACQGGGLVRDAAAYLAILRINLACLSLP